MSRRMMCVLGLVLLSSMAAPARAQNEFEITPFAGVRFGGVIDFTQAGIPTLDYLKIKNTENYGFMADYTFWTDFQGEFMWNRQPTSLSAHDPTTDTLTFLSNMNLDLYHFNIVYQFKSSQDNFRPFIVGGLGWARWGGASVAGQSILPYTNSFAYNLGGGVKYYFSDHFGVRAELRYSPSRTTPGVQVYCDPFYGCSQFQAPNKANQGQANIGLIFRFHK
jgi:opacity protein-like surface antigen